MARHSIDDAMLAAAGCCVSQPGTEVIVIDLPYATAKSTLLSTVARANRCKAVRSDEGGGRQQCTVVGHEADLAAVRTLFVALSMHAARSLLAAPVPAFDTPRPVPARVPARLRHPHRRAVARRGRRRRAGRHRRGRRLRGRAGPG